MFFRSFWSLWWVTRVVIWFHLLVYVWQTGTCFLYSDHGCFISGVGRWSCRIEEARVVSFSETHRKRTTNPLKFLQEKVHRGRLALVLRPTGVFSAGTSAGDNNGQQTNQDLLCPPPTRHHLSSSTAMPAPGLHLPAQEQQQPTARRRSMSIYKRFSAMPPSKTCPTSA